MCKTGSRTPFSSNPKKLQLHIDENHFEVRDLQATIVELSFDLLPYLNDKELKALAILGESMNITGE